MKKYLLKIIHKRLKFLLFVLFVFCFSSNANASTIKLFETGQGTIDHRVVIESQGLFRVAFLANMNYGLSEIYDLVNDPNATNNIAQNPTDYIPSAAQGGIFSQVLNPYDVNTIYSIDNEAFRNRYRRLTIIENTPARVIIETELLPGLVQQADAYRFIYRYIFFPDGKIYIKSTLHADVDYTITEWRHEVLGFGDPSFLTTTESGTTTSVIDGATKTITDTSKNWKPNQWVGYRFSQAGLGYQSFWVSGNDENTLFLSDWNGAGQNQVYDGGYTLSSRSDMYGWLRATDTQNPYGYSNLVAKYIFEYWDQNTPAPYTDWTKLSFLAIPKSNNPYQGKQALHEWKGFKRWYYVTTSLPSLNAGQEITREYLVQLGTKNSAMLPDINSSTVADYYANDYLNPDTLVVTTGTSTGFNTSEGAYILNAALGQVQFSINGAIYHRIKPAFKINQYNSNMIPEVLVDGERKTLGVDFGAAVVDSSVLIIQLFSDIDTNVNINISPGADVFPPENQISMSYGIDDFVALVSGWMKTESVSDLNADNIVNSRDLGVIMSGWN